eukprot:TRINITY_DN810_c4_g1_i1.p1 TRINITY_DN810_c4_g1~~TRINITY_DN810_c4_g1_i1.p1  ORF type:complete len:217 (+),score=55.34 TRINITY_DN810_c4_g1_i1:70-720(+)
MDASTIESCLQTVFGPKLKLAPGTIPYLATVLAELTPDELKDFEEVQMLLEPFLLDALKPGGRDRPHDQKSDARVEALCRKIFDELSTITGESVANSMDGNVIDTGSVSAKAAEAALRCAVHSTSFKLSLPDDVLRHMAMVISEMEVDDLRAARADQGSGKREKCVKTMVSLLEPALLDMFHECGEWAANEDEERLEVLVNVLLEELNKVLDAGHV